MSLLATADERRVAGGGLVALSVLAIAGLSGNGQIGLVAAVTVGLIGLLSPIGVLLAAIAALPFFYRPIDVGNVQFAASELLIVASAVGVGATMVRKTASDQFRLSDIGRQFAGVFRTPVFFVLASLAIVSLVLAAFPYDPDHRGASVREWRWTFAEPALLVGLLLWHRATESLPRLAALALIAGGSVAALYALLDLALGGGVEVGGVTRIAGPYPHPNALALMTVRIVALAFAWLVFDPRQRRLLITLLLICGVALAATFSRGAAGALVVATGLIVVHAAPRMRLVALASGIAVAGTAVIVARDRMLDLFGGGSGSLRLDVWTSAIEMIRDRPLQGYGPDQFLYAYLPRYVEPTAWNERFTAHAHNLVLDFWIRLGIIGGAFAIIAVLFSVRVIAQHIRETRRPLALPAAATVALAAALSHGMVDNAYFSHDLAMSGWLLVVLAFGPQFDAAGVERVDDVAGARGWRSRIHWLAPMRQLDR